MKIGIIDSNRNCYVTVPNIEQQTIGNEASVTLYQAASANSLPDEVRDCDGLISWHLVALDAAFIGSLRNCKGIVRAAVGFDNIDLDAARQRGIPVANVPDYGTEEVADHALAMALSLLRRLSRSHDVVIGGRWDWREVGPLPRISELHVGIIGCGRIGMAVALRFKAFGCRVSIFDPYQRSGIEKSLGVDRVETLHQLLSVAGLVSIHTPLTDETRHLIGDRELHLLEGKYLVNTARGAIIDGEALCRALANRRLKGVGLDVYEDEKEPIPTVMQGRDDVLLSPHIAFYSESALTELRAKAASVLSDLLKHGWHRNVV
ncbi:C-terminal binding protein [Burkholderia latens]|uniref:C-terminal binding protein n=1 Tax=Burkholderia latens TaxID=488446 RepID=A0A6H9T5H0_9BURK|nr:C-terminal binding protein [Burkholderia latens]KAB0644183.1 C-terminal binding protein [Burkholderia latens]VWB44166.1 dihydrofolate reductase [Burkholderia latens]